MINVWDHTKVEIVSWVGYGSLGWWKVRPLHPSRWQIAAMVGIREAKTFTAEKIARMKDSLLVTAMDWEIGRKVTA